MRSAWNDYAVSQLEDFTLCPRCMAWPLERGQCLECRADVRGQSGAELAVATRSAVAALKVRQELIDKLSTVPKPVPTTKKADAPTAATPPIHAASFPHPQSPAEEPSGSVSVQSVLAVAGAGLFAVAAFVFAFLNPDLTDFGTRSLIIGAITVVFLGGAWMLAKAGLRFSAEVVGALGLVFLVLDAWAVSRIVALQLEGFAFAGVATIAASGLVLLFAAAARLRVWLWFALLGLALSPALFGYAIAEPWSPVVGHLAVGFVALGTLAVAVRLQARFDRGLAAERSMAACLQLLVAVVVPIQLLGLPMGNSQQGVLVSAAILVALAALAVLAARRVLPRFWSASAGAFLVAAVGILPYAAAPPLSLWQVALLPLAASLALVALTMLPARATLDRVAFLVGGWVVALAVTAPTIMIAIWQLLAPRAYAGETAELLFAALLGLASAAAGTWWLSRTMPNLLPVAVWITMLGLLAVTGWGALLPVTQVLVGFAIALVLSALLTRIRPVQHAAAELRLPLILAAHAAVVVSTIIAWEQPDLRLVAGAAAVALIAAVAQTVQQELRPLHAAVGYAWALIVFATALLELPAHFGLLPLETIAVLCLTSSLASVVALLVTTTRRFSAGFWYAILLVTSIPFLIGVASVILERNWWTALSTTVMFALALALVVTRRPGMNRFLRGASAALLVPALAVVVVCVAPQLTIYSASPVVLPIIAAIVGLTLPSAGVIAARLVRRGMPTADARAVRTWIEVSTFVTAAIAVVLSLLRPAAGIVTTFQVFAILGLGGLAVGYLAGRRYGWWMAGASFTAALWCLLLIARADVAEFYLLPPALGAIVIGALSVARGVRGRGLFTVGLVAATLPSLGLLALAGSPGDLPWRTFGLLTGAMLLLQVGALVGRLQPASRFGPLTALRMPSLAIATIAAAAGTIQAVRIGLSLDPSPLAEGQPVMVAALAFSAVAALMAGASARLVADSSALPSRWLYVPAFVYLAVGPMSAIRDEDWFAIYSLLALTVALLAVMLVTVARALVRPVTLPPAWVMFALAVATAIAGWSVRDLRVEAHSLPLGFALLAAGVIVLLSNREPELPVRPGPSSWPVGFSGSWHLLAPGLLALLGPSVLATGTEPLTWRAILVIAIALTAILLGSLRRLAAPFVLGIVVLPIENVIVFVVEIGRSISAAPWWITLATAGAMLLVIAVTYEKRVTAVGGFTARLRDLR